MPAIERTVKLSDRLTVVMRELNAEESFDADEIAGDRRSTRAVMKTYAICSIRSLKYQRDGKDLTVPFPIRSAPEYQKFVRDPIGEPLTVAEMNAALGGFMDLDAGVSDPNGSSASKAPSEEGSSPEPSS